MKTQIIRRDGLDLVLHVAEGEGPLVFFQHGPAGGFEVFKLPGAHCPEECPHGHCHQQQAERHDPQQAVHRVPR